MAYYRIRPALAQALFSYCFQIVLATFFLRFGDALGAGWGEWSGGVEVEVAWLVVMVKVELSILLPLLTPLLTSAAHDNEQYFCSLSLHSLT